MILSTIPLWAALAVGFLVLEGCTVAMVSLWFAIGAAAALVLSLLGAAFWLQVLVFLAVSGLLLALLFALTAAAIVLTAAELSAALGYGTALRPAAALLPAAAGPAHFSAPAP